MTLDSGTLLAGIVAGVTINALVQGALAAFRHSNTIAVLRVEVDAIKASLGELRDAVRDSACKVTGAECAAEPVALRKVERH